MGVLVADAVFCVTNGQGKSRKERAFRTYPKIWQSELATFVKLCDRIANMRAFQFENQRLFHAYLSEYPIFRYALHSDHHQPMWDVLDALAESRS